MTTTYNTRTSLAAYVDALYGPSMQAISRVLTQSNGYLQGLANTASTAATAATTAATTATNAASQAQSDYNKTNILFVSFGKTWYGDLPSDPTDNPNSGGPLNIGARYWNTTDNKIRIYTSTGWQDFDAQAEQLQQEAAISASQAAKSASEAETSANTATSAANSIQADVIQIQKDLNELEALFTLPLPPNEIPQVNSTGTGFGFVKSGLLGVTAWSETVANNGGYPQYAVVCDPTLSGMLYESKVSSNTQRPSLTSTQWSLFSTTPYINVTSFGVVNDPTGENVGANTQNYLLALQQCAGQYCLVHPAGLTVIISGLSLQQDDIQWRLDGTIILNNNENADVIALIGGIQNFYLFGNGTINGSLLNNQNTNGQGSSTAMGSCISVNALTNDVTSSQPLTHNIVVEGITLKNAQYAFYGNNCVDSTVRKCRALQTTYGIIFSNGNGNTVEDCIAAWNGQLGVGINNTAYNTSIKNSRINGNWNQAINVYADGTQPPPQFCIIADNFIRDNFTNGINITVPTPSQTSTTAVLSSSDSVSNPIIDLKIMNNVFQNNGRGGTGNDVTANVVDELLICGNLFDRFGAAYKNSLSSSPNAVWINSDCQNIDVHSNTFKNVGSTINPGIQLWLNSPQNGTVHSNTFMDTLGVTQNWWGGSIDGFNTIEYNVTVGSTTSSESNIVVFKGSDHLQGFSPSYTQGYTTSTPSSSNNNQAQCIWEFNVNPGGSETTTPWQAFLAAQATVTSGNTNSLQTILGDYANYSIESPVLTITSIQVNGVDIPLDSTYCAVSLADFSTIQYVSSQSGKGWQIETSSGRLIYSLGENTGEFEPGFCPPESVFITFEIVASNTVDGSTVPTVPTTSVLASSSTVDPPSASTSTGTTSTSSSDTGESMTVYAGNNWNMPFTFQIPTYLQTLNTFATNASKSITDESAGDSYIKITYSPSSPDIYSWEGEDGGGGKEWIIEGSNVPWIDILGKSATGNGTTLSELLGNYACYSSAPPTLKLVKVVVNGVEEPLNYEVQYYTVTEGAQDGEFGGVESPGTAYTYPYPCSQILAASHNIYGDYTFPPSQWNQIAQSTLPNNSDNAGYGIDASNGSLFFGNTNAITDVQTGGDGYYSGSPISSGTVEIYFVLEQNYISNGSALTQSGTTYYASNYWNQTIYGKQTV